MPSWHCAAAVVSIILLSVASTVRPVRAFVAASKHPSRVSKQINPAVAFSYHGLNVATATVATASKDDGGRWDAEGVVQKWASSLPLPENAKDDAATQKRVRDAMAGTNPPALEGRCDVDLEGFSGGVRFVHVDPPVLVVDNFLTGKECDAVLELMSDRLPPDAGRVVQIESRTNNQERASVAAAAAAPPSRMSTTWYVRYGCAAVAPLLNGLAELLPNVSLRRVEEVQLVRYAGSSQGFAWHEDALPADMVTPITGGQRVATVLVYLNECDDGGRTVFRHLVGPDNQRLAVSPRRGRALLFFPSATGSTALGDAASITDSDATFGDPFYDDTRADHRTSHAGEPPLGVAGTSGSEKHIAQLWIHSAEHTPVVFGGGLNKHSEAHANLGKDVLL